LYKKAVSYTVKNVTIKLDSHTYSISIAEGVLPGIGAACKASGLGGQAAVVTNPVVASLYADTVVCSLQEAGYRPVLIEIPDGEEFKNSTTLNTVYDRLIEAGLDRSCFVVALGGGVVGDLAGFAAATFLRGIPFVQVPTTLLAQVDSSVGGKTGIDHPLGKNLIGAFHQPQLVLSDISTLKTLSERHYLAGLAEVVKYGAVLDAGLFTLLEDGVDRLLQRDPVLLEQVVARCCEIKAWVVEQDEREAGLRAVLNYGHTLGHAFETLSGYKNLVHGEAVAIGMVQAAFLSQREGYCSDNDQKRIRLLLQQLKLPVDAPVVSEVNLVNALAKDKKNRSGTLQYICNRGIGSYAIHQFTPAQLAEACYSGR
jgi:3-dehydroquinate synthase